MLARSLNYALSHSKGETELSMPATIGNPAPSSDDLAEELEFVHSELEVSHTAGYLNDIARLHLCTNTSSELIHTLQESNALLQSVFLAHEEDSDFVMMQKDFRSSASAVPRVEAHVPTFTPGKFHVAFGLPEEETPLHDFKCCLFQSILLPGKLFVTQHYLCFGAPIKRKEVTTLEDYLWVRDAKGYWYKKWISLKERQLIEFETSNSEGKYFPQRSIPLNKVTRVERVDDPERPHVFRVVMKSSGSSSSSSSSSSHEMVMFAGDSLRQVDDWIQAVQLRLLVTENSDDKLIKVVLKLKNIIQLEQEVSLQIFNNAITLTESSSGSLYVFTSFASVEDLLKTLHEAIDVANKEQPPTPLITRAEGEASSGGVLNVRGTDAAFLAAAKEWRSRFHVPEKDSLLTYVSCGLFSSFILYHGTLYISTQSICFYSGLLTMKKQISIPYKQISKIQKQNTAALLPTAIAISTTDHRDWNFINFFRRDATYDLIVQQWKLVNPDASLALLSTSPPKSPPSIQHQKSEDDPEGQGVISYGTRNTTFHELFPQIPITEPLAHAYYASLEATGRATYGTMYLSTHNLCYYEKNLWGQETKLKIPLLEISELSKESGEITRIGYGIAVKLKDGREVLKNSIEGEEEEEALRRRRRRSMKKKKKKKQEETDY